MTRALLVLVLLASAVHADDDVALLPLDASAKLEVYGQPVASEIARVLVAGEIDVVVVLPKMGVPDSAKLIVGGTITAGKGGAIELALHVRDPKIPTPLRTLHATAPSLEALEKTTADLAQKVLAVVRDKLAELAKPPEPVDPSTRPPPDRPALPVAKPLLVAVGAKQPGALSTALDAAVSKWVLANHRTRMATELAALGAKTAPKTVAASSADLAIAFEVLSYKLWGKTVPMATARVRVRVADAAQVLFDRVIVTDTVVGDRGMAVDAVAERVAREVLAIARPHVRKVVPGWR